MTEGHLSDGPPQSRERSRAGTAQGLQQVRNVPTVLPSETANGGRPPAVGEAATVRPGRNQGQAGHDVQVPTASEPAEAGRPSRWASGDGLIGIADIRAFFKIGRTAAYELTHRPGFPDPVPISARRYRWWASEVEAFAIALGHERAQGGTRRVARGPHLPDPGVLPGRITGRVRAARARGEAS